VDFDDAWLLAINAVCGCAIREYRIDLMLGEAASERSAPLSDVQEEQVSNSSG